MNPLRVNPLRVAKRLLVRLASLVRPHGSAMDWYIHSRPDPQIALDIFKGQWSSRLPEPFGDLRAGVSPLFEDGRITWFAEKIGGFEGLSALELGPLEGGHAYMLEKMGASEVVSVEANTRAFLKCLIVKELFDLRRVKFLCGDFMGYLRNESEIRFDICIASGVLYHMRNPVELIALLAKSPVRHILLWTHYYDHRVISRTRALASKFSRVTSGEHEGFNHRLYCQEYGTSVYKGAFCGGPASTSYWMSREDILACLAHFGFGELHVGFDHPDHPNGPSFAVAATRSGSGRG